MSLLSPNVDYTQRDQKALELRLQGLIRSVFPKWTAFNKGGFGNILLGLFSFVGDNLGFYQDKQARDLFWPTVTERANAIRLGRLINFRLSSAQPATTTCRFSLPSLPVTEKPIPLGTRVRTVGENPIYYRTTESNKNIPTTGDPWVDVAVEQAVAVGYRNPDTNVLYPGETFGSSGGPNQQYTTLQLPVIDGTVDIEAEDGTYREVLSFLDNDPITGESINQDSRVFVTLNDSDGRAIIVFGNGKVGKIPEGNVTVAYKIGGGLAGNVDVGEISIVDSVSTDLTGVSVTNTVEASGGVDRMSVIQARAQGPQSLRVIERCVTKEDFEITALENPGIARAVMVTSNEDATVQENTGVLLLVAKGERLSTGRIAPATPSSSLLAEVLAAVTEDRPPTLTFSVSTAAATFRTLNISTRVYLSSGADSETVGQAIRDALADFFAAQLSDGTINPAIDFGANIRQADGTVISEIAWSDVFNAIRDTSGVRKVDEGPQGLLINSLRQSIILSAREFPKLGTVTIYDVDEGAGI